jgi:hypothetical protein
MAYFSNGTEGMVLDHQCSLCKYGDEPCPIYLVQSLYNYDACNNEVARKILDELIENNGTCAMFKAFKKDFSRKAEEKAAPSLYDICFPALRSECNHYFNGNGICNNCGGYSPADDNR